MPVFHFAWLVFVLAALICELDARVIHSLNGSWNFKFEGEQTRQVTVPHTWNARDAADGTPLGTNDARSVNMTGGYRRGRAVYTRTLPFRRQPGKRYFLRGEGASIVSQARINGHAIGEHRGAFTAFCYELTPQLLQDENTLEIAVDNTVDPEIAPLGGDFSLFGGLYRPVQIIETGPTCIDPAFHASPGVFIRTLSLTPQRAEIEVETRINSQTTGTGTLRVAITEPDGQVAAVAVEEVNYNATPNQPVVMRLALDSPKLWKGRVRPFLYRVTVSLLLPNGEADEVSQPLGLRTASISPEGEFLLNGQAMQLRGVSRHQDVAGKGWAVSREDEKRDIYLITDLGANALRTAHYPQSEHIYDLCDQAGLVVWSEVPCINEVRDTEAFRTNILQQAREMLLQHGNHPSICMWGLFNEIYHQRTEQSKGMDMERVLRELQAFIKELDPPRITVAASNQPGRTSLHAIPDYIAFNMYPGWYGGSPESMGNLLDARLKEHPHGIAVSEYGHGANPAMHESPPRRPEPAGQWHPEEWQALAHEANYREIGKRRAVWGAFIWNMFDFASDARNEGGQPGINDKGLITYDRRTPKDAYFFYRANWNPALTVHIASRRAERRDNATVSVKVYSNAAEVALSVNGRPMGTRKPDELRRAVWPEIRLNPGANVIVATAQHEGVSQRDTCCWSWEPPAPANLPSEQD